MGDSRYIFICSLIVALIIGGLVWFGIFACQMEANAFNRFSKTQITWWDALWADYRILPDK